MAITIQSEPQDYTTVTNPCEFTFSSTNTGQDNFSFIVRLTINGSVHSFHQVFPESSNYGLFDPSELLRSYVESQLITSGVIELDTALNTVSYSVAVKEKYGDPPVEVGSFVASSTVIGLNGSLRHIDWTNYNYKDYRVDTNFSNLSTIKYMSHFPTDRSRFCGINESQFLGIICTDTAANIKVTLKDVSGSTVATITQALAVPSNDLFILDVSPQTIISDTTLTSVNFDNSYSYEIQVIANGAGSFISNATTEIIIDRECSLYDGKRLHWLNKFGVWESFTFRLYHEESTSIKSKQYQKNLGAWNASNEREYNRYLGEKTFTSKTSEDTLTLNSDWIHQDVQQWLSRSLYESPIAYLEVSQGVFEPVLCTKSSYTQKQRIKEGLIQENVKVDRTYIYRSQLG